MSSPYTEGWPKEMAVGFLRRFVKVVPLSDAERMREALAVLMRWADRPPSGPMESLDALEAVIKQARAALNPESK